MKDVHLCDFIIETEENEDHVRCRVKKNLALHVWRTSTFPIEEVDGSRFGTCTCGSPRMMGVPCVHMVVVLKSKSVEDLNENNFMPTWWMISQMHLQYHVDMEIKWTWILPPSCWRERWITTFITALLGRHQGNLAGQRVKAGSKVPSREMAKREVVRR
jgi:hypothetical protein